jgi:hypothetical protein
VILTAYTVEKRTRHGVLSVSDVFIVIIVVHGRCWDDETFERNEDTSWCRKNGTHGSKYDFDSLAFISDTSTIT